MTKYKILALSLSLVSLLALAALISDGVSGLDQGAIQSTRTVLAAGSASASAAVPKAKAGMTQIATTLTNSKELSQALAGLLRALKNAKPPEERPPPQQNRIDKASDKLGEYREAFRAYETSINGVTFVDENGVVLQTDSELFKEGAVVELPPLAAPPLEGEDESMLLEGEGSLIQFTIAGHTLDAIATTEGRLYYVAAAPIYRTPQRKKVIGAGLVDRRVSELPPLVGVGAFLTVGGQVTLGQAPEGFAEPEQVNQEAFRALAGDPGAEVPSLFALPYLAFLGDDHQAGTWVQRFSVPGTEEAWGYVFVDLLAPYPQMRGLQMLPYFLALVVWLVHAVLIVLDGRPIRSGVTQISDFLGQVTTGATDARNLPERKVPAPVRRLARLLNQVLEHYVGGGPVQPLPAAPSVDEVLEEAKVDEVVAEDSDAAPDFDALEFKGVPDAGTLDVEGEAPGAAEVGEAVDGYDDSIAAVGQAVVEATAEPRGEVDLPAGEAAAAIDHLDDEPQPPSRPPPPPPDALETEADEIETGGLAAKDRSDMMQVTPGLLDQLKADVEQQRQTTAQNEAESPAEPRPPKKKSTGPAPMPPPPPGGGDGADDEAETAVMKVSPEQAVQMNRGAKTPPPPPPGKSAPPPPPSPAAAAGGPEAARQAHFKEVYDAFVKTRKECGEKGELAFDKFAKRLDQSRAAVIQKHKCSDVRFQVYVKNGKAALKATPAK